MTIVKKYDSIQGGREGGIQLSRASASLIFLRFSAHLIAFVLERMAIQIRFSAGHIFGLDLHKLDLIY